MGSDSFPINAYLQAFKQIITFVTPVCVYKLLAFILPISTAFLDILCTTTLTLESGRTTAKLVNFGGVKIVFTHVVADIQ